LSGHDDLSTIDRSARARSDLLVVRLLLPLGWLLAAIGYYGPWIGHQTAALTLGGVDMGEFVKFLPGATEGSPSVVRQMFYLPPLAIVAGVALLAGSRQLRFAWPLRTLMLALAVPVSLGLLPPAWSPTSLMATEFRMQTITLGICWLLLAGSWLLGQLPLQLAGVLGGMLALAAGTLSAWQFLVAKPAIDAVYLRPPPAAWGLFLCMAGLAIMAVACVNLVFRAPARGGEPWSNV
jgi:hypothetical protein